MEKATADLGSLCLVSTTADLELQLDSHAELAANDPHFTAEELTRMCLDLRSATKPFIMLAGTFKLVVSLDADETNEDSHSLMQTFSQRLYHSKIWHQLFLNPASMTLSGDRIIAMEISHSDDERSAAGRPQYHKLSDSLLRSSDEVPPGISKLLVSSIHLAMRINRRQEPKRRTLARLDKEEPNSELSDPALHVQNDELLAQGGDSAMRVMMTPTNDTRRPPCVNSPATEAVKHEPERFGGSHGMQNVRQNHGLHMQQDILDLLDAGIRHAITASPKRPARGIQLVESNSLKPLATLAPSIWSPGYLTAMSSRSVLLPTISHALSNVGVGNARSTNLRAKSAEVVRRSQHSSSLRFPFTPTPDQQKLRSAQLSIGSMLWRSAQSTLFDSSSASQLNILSTNSDISPNIEYHEVLDPSFSRDEGEVRGEYDLDVMMGIEDSGYVSGNGKLSSCASLQPLSPKVDHSQISDEEMLST